MSSRRVDTSNKQAPEAFVKAQWKPGQSGNPAGRPKGARSKINEDFLKAIAADFEAHGEAAIVAMREEKPAEYVKVVASLLPKQAELEVNANDAFIDLWRLVSAGRAAEALMEAEAKRDGETIQ